MKEDDDGDFAEIMAAMASAYQIKISSYTTGIYFLFLKDLPFEKVHKAMVEIMATEDGYKLPSIASIRKKALGVEDHKLEDEAMEAWGQVLKNSKYPIVKDVGALWFYREVSEQVGTSISVTQVPIDNKISRAVEMAFGGWDEFKKTDIKDETWDRLHFIRCYKAIARERQKKLLLGSGKVRLLKE